MWKNTVERDRPQMIIWRMRIACWMPKATNTHTHTHRLCNTAFPQQLWLHERASMLRSTHIARLIRYVESWAQLCLRSRLETCSWHGKCRQNIYWLKKKNGGGRREMVMQLGILARSSQRGTA